MDTYSEAPNDIVVRGEVISPGAVVEATDGPVGRVERVLGPRPSGRTRGENDATGDPAGAQEPVALLVRTASGQALEIASDAVSRVIPDQSGSLVYLRLSRAALGLADAAAAPTATQALPETPPEAMREAMREDVEDITLPLAEERLTTSKQWSERGRVHIHKRVQFENQRLSVPLNYEEVIVEHIAPERFDADAPRGEDELIIPVVEERLVVRKETVIKEYLRVRKQSRVRNYQLRGQVRREVIQVDETPNPAFGDALPLVRREAADASDERATRQ